MHFLKSTASLLLLHSNSMLYGSLCIAVLPLKRKGFNSKLTVSSRRIICLLEKSIFVICHQGRFFNIIPRTQICCPKIQCKIGQYDWLYISVMCLKGTGFNSKSTVSSRLIGGLLKKSIFVICHQIRFFHRIPRTQSWINSDLSPLEPHHTDLNMRPSRRMDTPLIRACWHLPRAICMFRIKSSANIITHFVWTTHISNQMQDIFVIEEKSMWQKCTTMFSA